jgi:hypothetical protein
MDEIAANIKVLERNHSIHGAIEIGRWLHIAYHRCKHGEYKTWLKKKFEWSDDTAMNFRNVYALSRDPLTSDYGTWDMSLSAFYFIARHMKIGGDDPQNQVQLFHQAAWKAVVDVARQQRRITLKIAREIYFDNCYPVNTPMTRAEFAQLAAEQKAGGPASISVFLRDDLSRAEKQQQQVKPPPKKLLRALDALEFYLERNHDAWLKVGATRMRELLDMMHATYDVHFGVNAHQRVKRRPSKARKSTAKKPVLRITGPTQKDRPRLEVTR